MKIRKATRWTLTTPDGTKWFGNCPQWAGQPLPEGTMLERETIHMLGDPVPCTYLDCTELHMRVQQPADPA